MPGIVGGAAERQLAGRGEREGRDRGLAALATNAKRPSFEATSQQAARWPLSIGAVIVESEPSMARSYDAAPLDAPTPASETSRWPLLSKSNPNGVPPGATSNVLRSERRPSRADEERVDPLRAPAGDDEDARRWGRTSPAPASVAPACRKRVEPAIGVSPSLPSVKPLTVASAALFLLST